MRCNMISVNYELTTKPITFLNKNIENFTIDNNQRKPDIKNYLVNIILSKLQSQ